MSEPSNGAPHGARGKRRPHAQIHLPPLSADYALTLVGIFERAIEAIWRAHGEPMANFRELRALQARARAAGYPMGRDTKDSEEVDF